MEKTKYTQKQMFEEIIKLVKGESTTIPSDEMVAFAEKKLEQLANKSSKGSAKKDEEQEAFFEVMRDIMSECSNVLGMQCGAIARDERALAFQWKDQNPTSPQRVSAMLKKLVDCGDVIKTVDKKTSYFRLA